VNLIKYYAKQAVNFIKSTPAMEARLRKADPLTYWLSRASLVWSIIALIVAINALLATQ
jgi:hypothetical protein